MKNVVQELYRAAFSRTAVSDEVHVALTYIESHQDNRPRLPMKTFCGIDQYEGILFNH